MTESCFAIRRNGAPAGRCAALPKQQPTRHKQGKESMNKIVSVDGDTTFYGVIADLGLDFVHSPAAHSDRKERTPPNMVRRCGAAPKKNVSNS